jgi:hypothetical protein
MSNNRYVTEGSPPGLLTSDPGAGLWLVAQAVVPAVRTKNVDTLKVVFELLPQTTPSADEASTFALGALVDGALKYVGVLSQEGEEPSLWVHGSTTKPPSTEQLLVVVEHTDSRSGQPCSRVLHRSSTGQVYELYNSNSEGMLRLRAVRDDQPPGSGSSSGGSGSSRAAQCSISAW